MCLELVSSFAAGRKTRDEEKNARSGAEMSGRLEKRKRGDQLISTSIGAGLVCVRYLLSRSSEGTQRGETRGENTHSISSALPKTSRYRGWNVLPRRQTDFSPLCCTPFKSARGFTLTSSANYCEIPLCPELHLERLPLINSSLSFSVRGIGPSKVIWRAPSPFFRCTLIVTWTQIGQMISSVQSARLMT